MSQSFYSAHVRAFPDGKTAVAWGEPIGHRASSPGFSVIDLASGSVKRLDSHGVIEADGGKNFTVSSDGKSILSFVHSGALTRIFRFPVSGHEASTQLLTVTGTVWFLEGGPGDSFYANMVDRPIDVVRFPPDGKARNFPAGTGPQHHGCSSRRPGRPAGSRVLRTPADGGSERKGPRAFGQYHRRDGRTSSSLRVARSCFHDGSRAA
jgi:hypothetical protein